MYFSSNFPWMKIHEFLNDMGNVRDPKEFCVQAVKNIHVLIPYDQARIYFVNKAGKIYDEFLIGVEKWWSDAYLEYFSKIDGERFSVSTRYNAIPIIRKQTGHYTFPTLGGSVYDWKKYNVGNKEFSEYIRAQRINHSAGFAFRGVDNNPKSIYALDRTRQSGYSREEIGIMSIIQSHLDNLHKNMFVLGQSNCYVTSACTQDLLTKRELEISELLCSGLTPIKISCQLFVSLSTVYRHIANIHKKLNVSNRQELLLKLLAI